MIRIPSIPVAAGAVVIAALLAASLWYLWPFWFELVPVEVPIVVLLGGAAALAAGRPAYRVVLASLLLIVAMALLFLITAVTTSQAPGCGGVVSNTILGIVFAPLFVASMPAIPVLIVVGAPVFAYVVLSRRPLLVRMGAVAVLLVVLAGATAMVAEIRSGYSTTKCIDF
jgi:hypothetical protein